MILSFRFSPGFLFGQLAQEFARFEELVRRGQPFDGTMLVAPRGVPMPDEYLPAFALQQRIDLERSVAFCHALGIGERA